MVIGTTRLSGDASGHVRNEGDEIGDDFASMTPVEREIGAETVSLILGLFRRGGDFICTKVRARRQDVVTPAGTYSVSGYVTMLKFVNNCTVPELELHGGMVPGLLRNGADVFFVDHGELSANNIAPRYTTQWSAGVSPSDLIRSGTTYHPSYPPSVTPIFQCGDISKSSG